MGLQIPIQMQPGETQREPSKRKSARKIEESSQENRGVPIGIRIVTERRRPKQTKLKQRKAKSAAQAEKSSKRERDKRGAREHKYKRLTGQPQQLTINNGSPLSQNVPKSADFEKKTILQKIS